MALKRINKELTDLGRYVVLSPSAVVLFASRGLLVSFSQHGLWHGAKHPKASHRTKRPAEMHYY